MDANETIRGREPLYGDFTKRAAITDAIIAICEGQPDEMDIIHVALPVTRWRDMDPVKRQAIRAIADKLGRILNGDPEHVDNWHDIQGYAKLAEDRCVRQGDMFAPKSTWFAGEGLADLTREEIVELQKQRIEEYEKQHGTSAVYADTNRDVCPYGGCTISKASPVREEMIERAVVAQKEASKDRPPEATQGYSPLSGRGG